MPKNKRLYRSNNRWLGGVCAGIAEYFDWDPALVRVIYIVLTFSSFFSGIPIYLILWIVMPARPPYYGGEQ